MLSVRRINGARVICTEQFQHALRPIDGVLSIEPFQHAVCPIDFVLVIGPFQNAVCPIYRLCTG